MLLLERKSVFVLALYSTRKYSDLSKSAAGFFRLRWGGDFILVSPRTTNAQSRDNTCKQGLSPVLAFPALLGIILLYMRLRHFDCADGCGVYEIDVTEMEWP
jgi:hypothetical protein